MKKEVVHIAFGLYDRNGDYSRHTATTIASIFSNTNADTVAHILHDDTLLESNRHMFSALEKKFNQRIEFHEVELPSNIFTFKFTKQLSPGALFRISISEMLKDLDKVIYLDSDIIACLDILELWNINMDGFSIAAVLDCEMSGKYACEIDKNNKDLPLNFEFYFNTGVIVFDLTRIRSKYDMWNECFDFLNQYPHAPWLDQPALNYVFQKDCKFISNKFNYWPGQKKNYENCIYHFAMDTKPYIVSSVKEDVFYWKYFHETPWGNNIEDFLKYYNQVFPVLDEGVLIHKIKSRKKFFKNVTKRFYKEIKLKLQGK